MSRRDLGRLPLTRKEEFKILLTNEIPLLLLSGFLTFIFLLPLLTDFSFGMLFYRQALANKASSQELFDIFLFSGLIALPCFFIYSIGQIGLFSCIHELVITSSCKIGIFFKGLAKNFKSCLPFAIFKSIIFSLLIINIGFLAYQEMNFAFKLIILAVNIIFALLTLLYKPYIMFESVTFNNGLSSMIQNAKFIFTKSIPLGLLNFLIELVPILLITLLPLNYIFIPVTLLAAGYISFEALVAFISNIHVFEENVEPDKIKSIYHAGLNDFK